MPVCNFNCAACPMAYMCVPMTIGAVVVWKRYASSPMQKKRFASQIAFLFLSNTAFLVGSTGFIYSYFYCWEAPLAAMACPIGILEHAAIEHSLTLLIYLAGSMALVFMIFGRAACGWACPIGFMQDILGGKKVKNEKRKKADKKMRYLKYAILAVIAPVSYITGTMAYTNICPVGGLTATIPALILDPHGYTFGTYFVPKMTFVVGLLILAVLLSRGWCRHLCPIGAMMAPFNKVSILQLRVDFDKCIHCGKCEAICPMDIKMPEDNRSMECVRCGKCVSVCPVNAITLGFK